VVVLLLLVVGCCCCLWWGVAVYLNPQERRAFRKALASARQVWEVLKYSTNTLQVIPESMQLARAAGDV
jgi:uncharacterized membrane protein